MDLVVLHEIKTDKYEIILYENDFIYLRYLENQFIDEKEILEMMEIFDTFQMQGKDKRLIHLENSSTISKSARELVQNYQRPALAEAFLLNSLPQKIILRAYNMFRKHKHPTRVFDSFEKAYHWLHSIE